MTPEQYKEQDRLPKEGDTISSPHEYIFTRGYPFTYKVLKVEKKRKGLLLTVKKTTPSKRVVEESVKVWFDEID